MWFRTSKNKFLKVRINGVRFKLVTDDLISRQSFIAQANKIKSMCDTFKEKDMKTLFNEVEILSNILLGDGAYKRLKISNSLTEHLSLVQVLNKVIVKINAIGFGIKEQEYEPRKSKQDKR